MEGEKGVGAAVPMPLSHSPLSRGGMGPKALWRHSLRYATAGAKPRPYTPSSERISEMSG